MHPYASMQECGGACTVKCTGIQVLMCNAADAYQSQGREDNGSPKLYLLMAKDGKRFKIGVPRDPVQRSAQLEAECDLARSRAWECTKHDARRVEKVLHTLLDDYRSKVSGNGGSEWFTVNGLPDAIQFIENYEERLGLQSTTVSRVEGTRGRPNTTGRDYYRERVASAEKRRRWLMEASGIDPMNSPEWRKRYPYI